MPKNKLYKYDKAHLRHIAAYQKQVEELYDLAAEEAARLATLVGELGDKPFEWKDYPLTEQRIDAIVNGLYSDLNATIENGINLEWQLSDSKNDELVATMLGDRLKSLTQAQQKFYFSATAAAASKAFIKRKTGGLTLSQRVWNYAQNFKNEMELALDCGIRDGKAANRLATQLKQYLKYPDKLFRRVRNEHGQLVLSKRARAFHPGRGVYRSSYMNARRLTATETNIAYRTADHERWQQLDFVVGIRVVLSNNHNCKGFKPGTFRDICDELSAPIDYKEEFKIGLYPKDFKFTGWHPLCRCHAVPVLKTQEEFLADLDRPKGKEATPSIKEVTDVPQEFKDWVNENKEKIQAAEKRGTLPYFIKDNQERVNTILSGNSSYKTETLDQLKIRLGAKLPRTLENLDKAISKYEKSRLYGDEAKAHKDELEAAMKKFFAENDYGMNIREDFLDKVYSSYFKNTFETGTSGGWISKKYADENGLIPKNNLRLKLAHKNFGLGNTEKQLERVEYEKYGSLLNHDILTSIQKDAGRGYGNVQVRFKKDKVLCTWTAGDSLNERLQPTLTTDPKACSFDDIFHLKRGEILSETSKNIVDFKDKHIWGYIELQYHGKLTLDCVDSLTFPYDITSSNAAFIKGKVIADKFKSKGITIYYVKNGSLFTL